VWINAERNNHPSRASVMFTFAHASNLRLPWRQRSYSKPTLLCLKLWNRAVPFKSLCKTPGTIQNLTGICTHLKCTSYWEGRKEKSGSAEGRWWGGRKKGKIQGEGAGYWVGLGCLWFRVGKVGKSGWKERKEEKSVIKSSIDLFEHHIHQLISNVLLTCLILY